MPVTVASLQKELEAITTHSKNCEFERVGLRGEKTAWVKTEAELRDDVEKLQESCSRMEQSRMTLESKLKETEARALSTACMQCTTFGQARQWLV